MRDGRAAGSQPRCYESAGAESVLDLTRIYNFNLPLRLGVAHGIAAAGAKQVYARLALPLQ